RRTSTVLETRGRAMKVSTGNRGVGAMADPATGRAKLTLSKVDWMGGRADRLRRDDEGNPRQALPVLLALRGTRRPAGPGLPVPRVRPIRGGPPETDGSPRRVRRTGRGGPPKEAGGDPREGRPAVTRSPYRSPGHSKPGHAGAGETLRVVPRGRRGASARLDPSGRRDPRRAR